MDVTKLTVPAAVVVPLVLAAFTADNVFVHQSELDAVAAEVAELKTAVEDGHDLHEAQSKLYTATRFWSDLYGREMMYKGQYEAGILSPEQIERYRNIQMLTSAALAERERYERDVEELQ